MEYSLPGNVLGINAFLKLFGVPTGTGSYNVPAGTLTLWAAMFALFQMFGQAFGGWQSDYFGRRFCLYSVVFWTYLGVTLEIISQNWRMWTGAKIVIGFATGVMQSVVPTYVAEVAPRECRAINLGLCHLTGRHLIHHILSSYLADELWLAVFGALISTLVTYGTNTKWGANIDDQRAFRVPLYIGLAVPTLCAFFELFILVESPWWLLMKGKREQARKSLEYLYSWQKNVDIDAKFAELEYTLRKEAEAKELQKQSSYLECFKGVDLRRSFVAAFPQASSNLAGNNLNGQYATCRSHLLNPRPSAELTAWLDFFQIAGSENPLVNSVVTIGAYIPGRGVQSLKRGCQWSAWPQMSSRSSSLRTRGSADGLCSCLASSP
jgi:MFS family permease